ncbi:hypothetical protein [Acinetobacter pittii]|uniref:hypothetical protein n=1 Tax=Acinetobacter pittii TaxID=48296 RepID=UPI001F06F968|nr:hypothetical protein [Acinetobacter pittii]MCH2071020.1 hypothetical protein [Acinetobacter pittii]
MNKDKISLDEFVDYIKKNIDLDDLNSINSAAPMLIKLSNDKDLLPKAVCDELRYSNKPFQESNPYQASGYVLYKDEDFVIRAVCWISDKERKFVNVDVDRGLLIYSIAHDHDFSFLTVGHYGSGYYTETYEYDYDSVIGETGESIEMKKISFNQLKLGQTYLFRAGKEIHQQRSPDDFSISLNLIVRKRGQQRFNDQYAFDLKNKKIIRPLENDTFKRAQTVHLIADLLGSKCSESFWKLKDSHSCRRTRIEIMKELTKFNPALRNEIWENAKLSSDPILSNAAYEALK